MRTLICISGLPYATTTITLGGLIAGLSESDITLLTVVEDESQRAAAEAMLAEAKRLISAPDIALKVRQGKTVDEIIQESKGEYNMIVVGSRVLGSFLDIFLQSVSRRVSNKAPISVLVVREDHPELRRILICTGGRQLSQSVVLFGARLAEAAGAQVEMLHVADPLLGVYTGVHRIDEQLPRLLESNTPIARHLRWGSRVLSEHQVQAKLALRRGTPVDEILREAVKGNFDLIIIGPEVESGLWSGLLMDKVTPQVVDRAPCSVLVVRSSE
ncbi:MAG: universal stress protein [Anaerolineae bacterium]